MKRRTTTLPGLRRDALAEAGRRLPCPPVRMVHMGLGAFHRSHQAWYTDRCSDAWGIAAFTGRRPDAAMTLTSQDGLYSLVERGPDRDRARIVSSIVEAVDGSDLRRFAALMAAPRTALVTLTVTEAGYHLKSDGSLDEDDPEVRGDLDRLRTGRGAPVTALGRLLHGLRERRRAGGGALAIVPCDNLPDNGGRVERALMVLGAAVGDGLATWMQRHVSCVSTSVDRITPALGDEEAFRIGGLLGWRDAAVVLTEPFHDWVLCGEFPAGRPPWEQAGAHFVGAIEPFERRKLWLLNGAHSLLACAGPLRGHATVAEAMGDTRLRAWVEAFWCEASRHLSADVPDVDGYCRALVDRFSNARIRHALDQIGMDSSTKLQVRVVPVAEAERAAGRDADACARVVACWVALRLRRMAPRDAHEADIHAAISAPGDAVQALTDLLSPRLARDVIFMRRVRGALEQLPSVSDLHP